MRGVYPLPCGISLRMCVASSFTCSITVVVALIVIDFRFSHTYSQLSFSHAIMLSIIPTGCPHSCSVHAVLTVWAAYL